MLREVRYFVEQIRSAGLRPMGYFVLKPDNNIESGASRPQDEFYRDNKGGIGNIEDWIDKTAL